MTMTAAMSMARIYPPRGLLSLARRAPRVSAPTKRSPAARSRTVTRTCAASPSAPPGWTMTPWRCRRSASSAPSSPSARSHRTLAWLRRRRRRRVPRSSAISRAALGGDAGAPRRATSASPLRSASSAPAWASSLTPELGRELLEQRLGARAADGVAAAQAGQAPGLGERAEDEQARVVARAARASRRAPRRRRSRAAPRRAARRRARAARSSSARSVVGAQQLARRVVGVAQRDERACAR